MVFKYSSTFANFQASVQSLGLSNPENDFNQNPKLGIHSIGLVPKIEIKDLNDLGYGLTSWNGVQVFSSTEMFDAAEAVADVAATEGLTSASLNSSMN